ncbi:MAG: hypothetical protein PHQ37_07930, partial [Methanocellales archaeon]|nr:hypothetical protein [Methanocellales archaeon]
KAFGIMDNQSALLADWDLPTLKDLLEELDSGAFDMELTGFNVDELEEFMLQAPPVGLDDNPKDGGGDTCKCPKCGFEFTP